MILSVSAEAQSSLWSNPSKPCILSSVWQIYHLDIYFSHYFRPPYVDGIGWASAGTFDMKGRCCETQMVPYIQILYFLAPTSVYVCRIKGKKCLQTTKPRHIQKKTPIQKLAPSQQGTIHTLPQADTGPTPFQCATSNIGSRYRED